MAKRTPDAVVRSRPRLDLKHGGQLTLFLAGVESTSVHRGNRFCYAISARLAENFSWGCKISKAFAIFVERKFDDIFSDAFLVSFALC